MRQSTLSNGLTVISDFIPNLETVSLGIFVNIGSVNENNNQKGMSHLLEHMLFKGTEKRSALQISKEIESVGGLINAFTDYEATGFYLKLLKDNLELGLDILCDMIQNPTFAQFDLEKEVVIQEIKMINDTPDELIWDLFQSKCFENQALGSPILGFEEEIIKYTPIDIRTYQDNNYSLTKMAIIATGNVNFTKLCELAEKYTSNFKSFRVNNVDVQSYQGGIVYKEKDLEQTHLVFGFEGAKYTSKDKYKLMALSNLIGDGSSSILFQEIREKRGLAYSISSSVSSFRDSGTFGIYAACGGDKAEEVIDIIKSELNNLKISREELNKAKMQLKSKFFMEQESSSARMENIAFQYLFEREVRNDFISEVDSLTLEELQESLTKMVNSKPTIALMGRKNINA